MDKLPDEVLAKIFSYIPATVRRARRLVCRRWNRICCDRRFTKNEQIFFNNIFQFHVLAPHVQLSEREIFNLSFENQSLLKDTLLPSFWEICGNRVESLDFRDCILSFMSLLTIIRFCPQLKRLSIKFSSHHGTPRQLKTDFHVLERDNFVAESVTSFHLQFNDQMERKLFFTNYSLHKIISVFPNATELSIMMLANLALFPFRRNAKNIDRFSKTMWTVADIAHHVQSICPNVTKLSLIDISACTNTDLISREQRHIPVLTRFQKLKELTLNLYGWNRDFPQKLFSLQNTSKITSLTLFLSIPLDNVVEFYKPMSSILNAFSNLSTLILRGELFQIDANFIEVLLASKLKTFHFVADFLSFAKIQSAKNFQVNLTLEELVLRRKVSVSGTNYCTFPKFAKYLPNLCSLEVTAHRIDCILQSIFKYQKRLRKLVLNHCRERTDFGFSGISGPDSMDCNDEICSISELKELESLTLYDMDLSMLSRKAFSSFLLPKLTFFSYTVLAPDESYISSPIDTKHVFYLIEAIKNFHLLEALYLSFKGWFILDVAKELKKLLSELSRIKYVYIVDRYRVGNNQDRRLTNDDITELFKMRPSLRMLHHNGKTFYYDILKDGVIIHEPKLECNSWIEHQKFSEKFS